METNQLPPPPHPHLKGSPPSSSPNTEIPPSPGNLNQEMFQRVNDSYPDQSLPQSKGGDIVALFLPLKGEIPGIELVCWSGIRLECVPGRIFCRRPGTWINRGRNLSVLCLSDCEEANKPKCFIRMLPAPCTCQSGFIPLSNGTLWTFSVRITFTEMRP